MPNLAAGKNKRPLNDIEQLRPRLRRGVIDHLVNRDSGIAAHRHGAVIREHDPDRRITAGDDHIAFINRIACTQFDFNTAALRRHNPLQAVDGSCGFPRRIAGAGLGNLKVRDHRPCQL